MRFSLLGGLSPAQFLKRYWQKQPLLIRGAFPRFRDPISRDELAGLSCEEQVMSRLVMERGGEKPWQVIPGPQQVRHLRTLPESHWTLLVQGVDRYIPKVASLLDSFRFIPDWRVEDVMISFAPRAGTVGPHIDSYDVFLLQGQGRRRWQLDSKASTALRPHVDVRILKRFKAEHEWILEPGDMLYLPPGLAHYGVALEECLTYSIGFRAPNAMELLNAAQERLMQSGQTPARYEDPHLRPAKFPAEIPRRAVDQLRRLLESGLRGLGGAEFDALAGEILTESKGGTYSKPRHLYPADLRSRLTQRSILVRSPGSRLAFLRRGQTVDLFADGRRYPLESGLAFAAALLTAEKQITFKLLAPHLAKKKFFQLLTDLMNAGVFFLHRS